MEIVNSMISLIITNNSYCKIDSRFKVLLLKHSMLGNQACYKTPLLVLIEPMPVIRVDKSIPSI